MKLYVELLPTYTFRESVKVHCKDGCKFPCCCCWLDHKVFPKDRFVNLSLSSFEIHLACKTFDRCEFTAKRGLKKYIYL